MKKRDRRISAAVPFLSSTSSAVLRRQDYDAVFYILRIVQYRAAGMQDGCIVRGKGVDGIDDVIAQLEAWPCYWQLCLVVKSPLYIRKLRYL